MPFSERAANAVEVRIDAQNDGFHAVVSSPTRELASGDCDDLVSAIAMVLTLSLDQAGDGAVATTRDVSQSQAHWSLELSDGARAALQALEDESPQASPAGTAISTAPATPPRRLSIDLSVSTSIGSLPGVGLGGSLGMTVRRGRFWLQLSGAAEASAQPRGAEEVRGVLAGASLAGCGVIEPFFGCVSGRVGALILRADQVVQPSWLASFSASTGLRVGAGFCLGNAYLSAAFSLEVALTRPEFFVGDSLVFEPSPVAGALSLGVSWFAS
ncbi:MAG: hypothetical protein AAF938_12760 [Myxococcota bacterium]